MVRVESLRKVEGESNGWKYKYCSIMTAESRDELQEFGDRLGLKREWMEFDGPRSFYKISANMRRKALSMGAIPEEIRTEMTRRLLRRTDLPVNLRSLGNTDEWVIRNFNVNMQPGESATLDISVLVPMSRRESRRPQTLFVQTNGGIRNLNNDILADGVDWGGSPDTHRQWHPVMPEHRSGPETRVERSLRNETGRLRGGEVRSMVLNEVSNIERIPEELASRMERALEEPVQPFNWGSIARTLIPEPPRLTTMITRNDIPDGNVVTDANGDTATITNTPNTGAVGYTLEEDLPF